MTDRHNHRAALAADARTAYETAAADYRENLDPERDLDEVPPHLAELYSHWMNLEAEPLADTMN